MTDPSPTDLPRGYQHGSSGADPSALTVAMLDKAIAGLREIYDGKLAETALALKASHDDMTRVPTLLDRAIASLRDLFDTRIQCIADGQAAELRTIAVRFSELEKRAKDLDEARATALIAALAAAKELVGAANANFTKQIDALLASFTTQITSLDGKAAAQITALDNKVNDLKDRLTQISGMAQGGQDAHTNRRLDTGAVVGIIGAAGVVLMLMGTVATVVLTRPVTSPQVLYAPAPVSAPSAVPR